jgi:hypothetical protein
MTRWHGGFDHGLRLKAKKMIESGSKANRKNAEERLQG